ncbi:MAG: hypothetical protein P8P71_04005, partial [Phycisphaerales bacterium]|nr:hypothetical protein [Phycisphaerales bacterium]
MFATTTRLFLAVAGALSLTGTIAAQSTEKPFDPDFVERLTTMQESLIRNEVTGSNIILVGRDGELVHRSVRNSGRRGDRDITEETLFPIWSMS